jgi:hypothetical protein
MAWRRRKPRLKGGIMLGKMMTEKGPAGELRFGHDVVWFVRPCGAP